MGVGHWVGLVVTALGAVGSMGAEGTTVDVASPTASVARHAATPEQHDLLLRMAKGDLQVDRLKRCLDYPDPPGLHWQRATDVGFCHNQFDTFITLKDVRAELDRHAVGELDRQFAKLAQEQRHDVTRSRLDDTLFRAFGCACKDARNAADAWLVQSPKSPWARAASGIQYSAEASAARGTEFFQKTPPERILRMEELDKKAVADLDQALALVPDLTAASSELIAIDRTEGRTDEAHNRMIEALRRAPASLTLHMQAVPLAEPKWGGTPGELQAARRRMLDASVDNPMLLQTVTYLDWQAQECDDCKWDMRNYQPMLDMAPSLAVLRKAGIYEVEHHDFAMGAIYLSEVLRFSPTTEVRARTDRGFARAELGDLDGAQNDAETALLDKADFQPAMQLLRLLTAKRAEADAVARRANEKHG